MMNSNSTVVRIHTKNTSASLTKSQKQFNRLIQKLDRQRQQLAAWQQTVSLYQQKYIQEFKPLFDTFKTLQSEFVQLLDKRYQEKNFTQTDRRKMQYLICDIASNLMVENDDETLKAIYNRHSEMDFDTELKEEKDAIKEMMQAILGVEMEEEIDSLAPERLLAQVGEKMQQKLEQEERLREERRNKRPKTAKALAKEQQAREEAQDISKSLQAVYRQLASTLHPDKERDPAERDRKTQLMQQVNAAYDKKDLLRLLELQLAAEQIDQTKINTLSEARLVHYNKILSEQSKELECEVSMLCSALAMRFYVPPQALSTPDSALKDLERQIRKVKQDTVELQADLAAFEQDTKNLKKFLKTQVDLTDGW